MTPEDNKMHPEDLRNMIIFFMLAMGVYLVYNHLVVKPRAESLAESQRIQRIENMRNESDAALKKLEVLPRSEAISKTTSTRVPINGARVMGSLNLNGAKIDDIVLRDYFETLKKEKNYALLSPQQTNFPRNIQHGWLSRDTELSLPDEDTPWEISGNQTLTTESAVTLTWTSPQGLKFTREISVDDNFMFTITQSVENTSEKDVSLYPYAKIAQKGMPDADGGRIVHEGLIGWIDDELHEITYKKIRKDPQDKITSDHGWIGITEKYWMSSVIPSQDKNTTYSFKYTGSADDKENQGRYQVDFVGEAITVPAKQIKSYSSHAFVGPKEIITLRNYRDDLNIRNFDLALDFGVWWFLSKPFSLALHFLGGLVTNMGIAIIILTIIIRSSVFPLTNKSYKSFAKMKKVGPEMKIIREKYGEDKVVLQQKIMELYQKEGVSPMSGCFPLLLQIPIFFALYKTFFVSIEMRHAPFFGWIQDLSAADPTTVFNLFGLIPWQPPQMLMIGVWPCCMLVAMMIQRRLNPPPTDPIQRDMMRWFPFIMAFVMARFAAGLVVYWTFSAVIGIIQQIIIMRSMNVPIYLFGEEPEADFEVIVEEEKEDTPKAEEPADKAPKQITPPKPKKKTATKKKPKGKKKG